MIYNFWCTALSLPFLVLAMVSSPIQATEKEGVQLEQSMLKRDGAEVGYLFGAEVQYFRARGGSGRNVPKETVVKLWNNLLDRVVEAGMNTVTLYIPWDFHEPVEGVFDFEGILDQDKDGRPDYPSRDVKTFLRMIESRGLTNVMVRPGPYINAEWGPEGFGAVPRWFLDHYPEALTGSRTPGRPRTVSFGHSKFRELSSRWLTTLHSEVLKEFIGPKKLISFIQIDNESNYFWDSIYERDISLTGRGRYTAFLQRIYRNSIATLNKEYGADVVSFSEIEPPASRADQRFKGARWLYDWALFHDDELLSYYKFLRGVWTDLGVVEPQVLFTSCDSFNALDNGLLPRLDYRQRNKLSLTTMNIYPKTFGTQADSTMNTPMKGAHDAVLVASSHRQYYGTGGDWVMSTETVGGWFAPVEVSLATRQHTYGSLLGAGIKAMSIYYFHEGWNWTGLEGDDSELKFDAPLDKDMNPRSSFQLIKKLGQDLKDGLGQSLMTSRPIQVHVLIAHDSHTQYNNAGKDDALKIASTDSAALFGLFREAGANPDVAFLDAMRLSELKKYRLVVWNHPGYISKFSRKVLEEYVQQGGTLLVIGDFKIPETGSGKVIYKSASPAEGWNGDEYLKLSTIKETLSWTKNLLATAQIVPESQIDAKDGQPFLHVTLRRSPTALLMVIENFAKGPRVARVRIRDDLLPFSTSSSSSSLQTRYRLQRRLNADHTAMPEQPILVSKTMLTGSGVELPVSADGVDIWELVQIQ